MVQHFRYANGIASPAVNLLKETALLLVIGAALMAIVRPLRWNLGLATAIVAAVLAADYFAHNLKPVAETQRLSRATVGITGECAKLNCRMLKDISYDEKVDQLTRTRGLDDRYLRWIERKMGDRDRYYLITGKKEDYSPFWNTYFLLPRIAVWDEGPRLGRAPAGRHWGKMAEADWVVVYKASPPAPRRGEVSLDPPQKFADGMYLVKVRK